MGFLKRALGGQSESMGARGPIPGLVALTGPIVLGPNRFLYASTTCPSCGVALDPLPTRKRACPACRQTIIYGKTPDGIRFLHREGDDLGLPREEAEAWQAEQGYGAQLPVRPGPLRDVRRRHLGRADALGLWVRIMSRDEDPRLCDPCRALDGQRYPAGSAPLLPFDGCLSRYVCNCEYVLERNLSSPVRHQRRKIRLAAPPSWVG